jgi:hypothetical protein
MGCNTKRGLWLGARPSHHHHHHLQVGAARGEAAADVLATVAAGAGHLVHMPGHTYVRTGRYHDAAVLGTAAAAADAAFSSRCVQPYLPQHNQDLLVFAAGMAVR